MQNSIIEEMEGRHTQSRFGRFDRSAQDTYSFISKTGDVQFFRRQVGFKKVADDGLVVYFLMRLVFAGDDLDNLSLDILTCPV